MSRRSSRSFREKLGRPGIKRAGAILGGGSLDSSKGKFPRPVRLLEGELTARGEGPGANKQGRSRQWADFLKREIREGRIGRGGKKPSLAAGRRVKRWQEKPNGVPGELRGGRVLTALSCLAKERK